MPDHTPEPWRVKPMREVGCRIIQHKQPLAMSRQQWASHAQTDGLANDGQDKANADHLCRCVNILAGTDPAKLDEIQAKASPEHRLNALGLYLQSVAMQQDTARRTAEQEAKA